MECSMASRGGLVTVAADRYTYQEPGEELEYDLFPPNAGDGVPFHCCANDFRVGAQDFYLRRIVEGEELLGAGRTELWMSSRPPEPFRCSFWNPRGPAGKTGTRGIYIRGGVNPWDPAPGAGCGWAPSYPTASGVPSSIYHVDRLDPGPARIGQCTP
jgi:hypothetical protein